MADSVLEDGEEVREAEVGHLVHVGVHVHLERAHDQSCVGSGRGDLVVERLPLHVRRVDGVQQLPAAHGGHGLIESVRLHPLT